MKNMGVIYNFNKNYSDAITHLLLLCEEVPNEIEIK